MNLTSKRIMLTGGHGFLGRHVHDALADAGCRQGFLGQGVGSSRYNQGNPAWYTTPSGNQWDHVAWALRHSDHDLTRSEVILGILYDLRPHIIIHLAALTGGIGANRTRPADFFYQNLIMGTQLLHHAYNLGVEKFVGIGTICAYPRDTPVPFQENAIWDGYPEKTNAPYGLAKKMLLVQSQAYRQQYGFNAIHLMPTNLYGPGDNFDLNTSHVIPALIRKFVAAKDCGDRQVEVWGTGKATREFLYVTDAATAIVRATAEYNGVEPLNVGVGEEVSIYDLVGMIRRLVGYKGRVYWDDSKPDGQPRRSLDTTRLKVALPGYAPQMRLEEGLSHTIEYYLKTKETARD